MKKNLHHLNPLHHLWTMMAAMMVGIGTSKLLVSEGKRLWISGDLA